MAAVNGMAVSFQKTWTATAENERFSPKILKERFQDIEVENLRNFEALRQIFRHRWTDGLIVADSIQSFGVPNTSCNEKLNSSAKHAADSLSTLGLNIGDSSNKLADFYTGKPQSG